MKYRRINFFGGGGLGKSTLAAYVFYRLKKDQYKTYLAPEYIKLWTYIPRKPETFDQYAVFGQQMKNEFLPLRGGEDLVVSDSPLLQQVVYARDAGIPSDGLIAQVQEFDRIYPALNILLTRDGIPFRKEGRFANLEWSKQIDAETKKILEETETEYETFSALEEEKVYDFVKSML